MLCTSSRAAVSTTSAIATTGSSSGVVGSDEDGEDEVSPELHRWQANYLVLKRRATEGQLALLRAFKQFEPGDGVDSQQLMSLERRIRNAMRRAELDFRRTRRRNSGSASTPSSSSVTAANGINGEPTFGSASSLAEAGRPKTPDSLLTQETSGLYAKIFKLESDNDTLKARATDCQLRADRYAAELTTLRNKITDLSTQLCDMQERAIALDSLSEMQYQLQEAQRKMQLKTETCQKQAEEIVELQSCIFRLNSQLGEREEEAVQLKAQVRHLTDTAAESYVDFQHTWTELNRQYNQLREDLNGPKGRSNLVISASTQTSSSEIFAPKPVFYHEASQTDINLVSHPSSPCSYRNTPWLNFSTYASPVPSPPSNRYSVAAIGSPSLATSHPQVAQSQQPSPTRGGESSCSTIVPVDRPSPTASRSLSMSTSRPRGSFSPCVTPSKRMSLQLARSASADLRGRAPPGAHLYAQQQQQQQTAPFIAAAETDSSSMLKTLQELNEQLEHQERLVNRKCSLSGQLAAQETSPATTKVPSPVRKQRPSLGARPTSSRTASSTPTPSARPATPTPIPMTTASTAVTMLMGKANSSSIPIAMPHHLQPQATLAPSPTSSVSSLGNTSSLGIPPLLSASSSVGYSFVPPSRLVLANAYPESSPPALRPYPPHPNDSPLSSIIEDPGHLHHLPVANPMQYEPLDGSSSGDGLGKDCRQPSHSSHRQTTSSGTRRSRSASAATTAIGSGAHHHRQILMPAAANNSRTPVSTAVLGGKGEQINLVHSSSRSMTATTTTTRRISRSATGRGKVSKSLSCF